MRMRYLLGVIASAGAAAAVVVAPVASADPTEISNQPVCTSVGGGGSTGTGITQCQTPGNVQISAEAPDVPAYVYPWDDEFYGSALIIGGGYR
ncbi:hypothetical protein TUM20985_09690 [Mycobacterium antarcticum]|uniref:hypothetical protein n=1 Tax=unclassified Mycolicibacterium TaxID=2636767 RepID=UPI00238FB8B3|nr:MULTISPECIES: hypothetical protein [unclassified Mycolicibacterium]BDX30422.1 hypothetical protein TUM20985_09690 [Mycolicibacterium sp. TUM20985]GLP73862.1 hypothetical protein TUM20983_09720 [Mycolicibacterium sp. TUM20983]GLP79546.1 hypothetical protein TUM20984_09660 [Mycolicibacterium sp. TUM20984]